MRAITLHQPWASLVATGAKSIETRSWSTKHRGPIAIHAAKGLGRTISEYVKLCNTEPFWSCLRGDAIDYTVRGAVVAVADLVACIRMGQSTDEGPKFDDQLWIPEDLAASEVIAHASRDHPWGQERALGDWSPGRYAWMLADVTPLKRPIAARGAQGLWDWARPIAEADDFDVAGFVRPLHGHLHSGGHRRHAHPGGGRPHWHSTEAPSGHPRREAQGSAGTVA